jgi:hypothetical protein
MKALNLALICCGGIGALSIAVACSSSTVVNNGDDGGTDSGSGDDSAAQDNFVPDTNVQETATDAGADTGNACPIIGMGSGQFTSGNATCDNCIANGVDGGGNCCSQATACFTPAADGGPSDCQTFTLCVVACQMDGGTLATCATPCEALTDGGGVSQAVAISTCVGNNCMAQCPGL